MSPSLHTAAFIVLAGLAFAPLEAIWGRHSTHADEASARPGLRADVGFLVFGEALVQLGLVVVVGTILGALDLALDRTPMFAPISAKALRTGLEVGVGLLVFEFMGYAYHRAAHRVPGLWRLHAVHHSAPKMDWLASFRQHPVEILLMTLVQNVPLVLLGLPLEAHAIVLLAVRLNTVFVHANLQLPRGAWQAIFAGPRFHHRHHQCDGPARNFAGMFPWIDRLFGTHVDETAGPVGLPTPMPETFLGLLVAPLRDQSSASGSSSKPLR